MKERGEIVDYHTPPDLHETPFVQTLALYVAVFFATGLALVIVIGSLYELLCWLVGHRL